MPRIISGVAGGRRIDAPPGNGTRPTGDRAREAMFASVRSELGDFSGLRVIDLYAGSGALGLEALSRGAAEVVFVEADRRAAATVRRNLGSLGIPGGEVVADKVERVLAKPASAPFDLLLADPPYVVTDHDVVTMLELARDNGWCAPDALVVLERSSRGPEFLWPEGFEARRAKRYGEATLWYGRASGRVDGAEAENV
ncbi:16S rRNA (guanine(966)-N(2))-methyltransferase RsmD [Spiractinospora alimapuensis]|uniref:16S rRNA (guanine(966)-N(2))-methyltransferase RsmD n=1 Tax=Spiractinospora alimapuensis TaxID=2820884 RepID=UPI001EEC27A8|nr:16S rRNA (guanine(966)-N(2))-methyltransferase RsmD [Spiractinospora alimapuensis]QVQ51661.1 16S rRNA (guanine(966)-N(2))-methyltransferase RsmD [Spiractinospora alimapuensis]